MRLLIASAATAALLVLAGGAGAQGSNLLGTVGPGFVIRLTDASDNPVTHLDPGTYTIQVTDRSSIHNFHLSGPGVDMATTIEGTGTVTWTVTLVAGTYHYQCDAHPTTMLGDVTVGTPATTTTTTTTTPPPPPRPAVALAAAVGPGKRIALTRHGVRVRVLRTGRVVITVADRSTKDDFHLVGPGVNRATSKRGTGTVRWRLTLRRGLYTYRSDATPTLRGTLRVTA